MSTMNPPNHSTEFASDEVTEPRHLAGTTAKHSSRQHLEQARKAATVEDALAAAAELKSQVGRQGYASLHGNVVPHSPIWQMLFRLNNG